LWGISNKTKTLINIETTPLSKHVENTVDICEKKGGIRVVKTVIKKPFCQDPFHKNDKKRVNSDSQS